MLGYNARLSQAFFGLLALVVGAEALRRWRWRAVRVPWPALAYLAAVALSLPASHAPAKSMGYAAWAAVDVAVFLVALPLLLRLYPALRAWTVGVYLVAALVVCEIAFAEIAALGGGGPRPASSFIGTAGFPRLQALFYEPAYLSFFLIGPLAIALVSHLGASGRARLWSAAVAVTASTTILLATARSGWLALAVTFAGAAILASRDRGAGRAIRDGAAVLAASAVLAGAILAGFVMAKAEGTPLDRAAAVPAFVQQLALFGAARGAGDDVALRSDWYALGLRVWSDSPLLGVGIGGFGAYVVDRSYAPAIDDPTRIVVPNMWIELLAETGLAGALSALALLASVSIAALRAGRGSAAARGCGLALLALGLVSFQFNNTFLRLDLWLPLGLASALAATERPSAR